MARLQISKSMKIGKARAYVAEKLGLNTEDLTNEDIMTEIRREKDIGLVHMLPGFARGLEAKLNRSRLLDLEINCVKRMRQ